MSLGGVALIALAELPEPAVALTGEITQEGWRQCSTCRILFFAHHPASGFGVCPGGGPHLPSPTRYRVPLGVEVRGVRQGGWSWCMHCMALYARVRGSRGVCPGARDPRDRGHVNFSGGYAAFLDNGGEDQESGWRWCSRCMGMFHAEAGDGICPNVDPDFPFPTPHDGAASLAYAQLIGPGHKP